MGFMTRRVFNFCEVVSVAILRLTFTGIFPSTFSCNFFTIKIEYMICWDYWRIKFWFWVVYIAGKGGFKKIKQTKWPVSTIKKPVTYIKKYIIWTSLQREVWGCLNFWRKGWFINLPVKGRNLEREDLLTSSLRTSLFI